MLHALKEIGEYALKEELKINDISKLSDIDNQIKIISESKNKHNKIIFICLDKEYKYKEVSLEEFKKEEEYLYMNKNVKGQVKAYAPIYSFDKGKEKEIFIKIIEFVDKEKNLIEIGNSLLNDESKIINDLTEKYNDLNLKKDEKVLVSLKIDDKYLFEIEEFKNVFIKRAWESILKESKKKKSICSICYNEKNIFTTSEIYKFYTNDKEGYIASGFNSKNSYKNFPICEECFLKLSYARKYIENYSTFNFYNGKKYNIIPKLIDTDKESLSEIIEVFRDRDKKINSSELEKITSDEKEILYLLKDFDNNIFINLFFLEKSNSAEEILLIIEDVLPSRIKKIFDIKKEIDYMFYSDSEKKYTLEKIYFLLKNGKIYDFYEFFLEITNSIFTNTKIDYLRLISIFNMNIRKKINEANPYFSKDPIINLIFLEKLNLIEYKGGKNSMKESIFDDFFKKYHLENGLNTEFKRGLFLLGSLVKYIIANQSKEVNSTSFYRHLKGLNLNKNDVKALVSKCYNKLLEYKTLTKRWENLIKEINSYFLIEENSKISVEEINFYISAGMSFYGDLKIFLEEKFPKVGSEEDDREDSEENL